MWPTQLWVQAMQVRMSSVLPLARLVRKVRVGDERAHHADHVGDALGHETIGQRRRIDAPGADHGQGHVLLQPSGQRREGARLVMMARPVGAPAARARHDALPHVEVVHLAPGFQQACHLAIVGEAQAVVLVVVVEADPEQPLGAQRIADRVHGLVEEGHPRFQGVAAVAILAAVGLGAEEVGEQVVHAHGQLHPVQVAADGAIRGRGELLDDLADLGFGHRVGHDHRHRQVRRGNG